MDVARHEPKRRLSDDERTVHDEQVVETKKDIEDASVERVVEVHPDELDFPDGGFRAWLIVFGVRSRVSCSLRCIHSLIERFSGRHWERFNVWIR